VGGRKLNLLLGFGCHFPGWRWSLGSQDVGSAGDGSEMPPPRVLPLPWPAGVEFHPFVFATASSSRNRDTVVAEWLYCWLLAPYPASLFWMGWAFNFPCYQAGVWAQVSWRRDHRGQSRRPRFLRALVHPLGRTIPRGLCHLIVWETGQQPGARRRGWLLTIGQVEDSRDARLFAYGCTPGPRHIQGARALEVGCCRQGGCDPWSAQTGVGCAIWRDERGCWGLSPRAAPSDALMGLMACAPRPSTTRISAARDARCLACHPPFGATCRSSLMHPWSLSLFWTRLRARWFISDYVVALYAIHGPWSAIIRLAGPIPLGRSCDGVELHASSYSTLPSFTRLSPFRSLPFLPPQP